MHSLPHIPPLMLSFRIRFSGESLPCFAEALSEAEGEVEGNLPVWRGPALSAVEGALARVCLTTNHVAVDTLGHQAGRARLPSLSVP